MRHTSGLLALAVAVAASLACGVSPEGGVDVDECSDGADIDDTIRIVYDAEDSLHEMVVCGQLSRELGTALSGAITSLIGAPTKLPNAIEYVGDGIYQVTTEQVVMDLWVEDGGTIVEGNLLDPADFFSNLRVENDGLQVVLRFDDAGPLAFLFGKGKNPSSPLRLDPFEIDDAVAKVGRLKMAGSLILSDELNNGTTVDYDLEIRTLKLTALAGLEPMEYEILALGGGRDDLGQSIDTLEWDIAYTDKTLDGTVALGFGGGPFDLQAEYVYTDPDKDPVITVTCWNGNGQLLADPEG